MSSGTERRGQEGTNPTLNPIATAARMAVDWLVGVGFLRFHAATFAVIGAVLIIVDLIQDPRDPWAFDALRIWLVVLASHVAALVAGWVTWKAIRPNRLSELPLPWNLAEPEDADGTLELSIADPPRPIPATGRFSPGRSPHASDIDEESSGLAGVLAAAGDAVLDLMDLVRAGLGQVQLLVSRGIEWVRTEDDDDEDEVDYEPAMHAPPPSINGNGEPPRPQAPGFIPPNGRPIVPATYPPPPTWGPRPASSHPDRPVPEHAGDAKPAPANRPAAGSG